MLGENFLAFWDRVEAARKAMPAADRAAPVLEAGRVEPASVSPAVFVI